MNRQLERMTMFYLSHVHMPTKSIFRCNKNKHLVALTLRHGTKGLLSRGLDFSISGVHGVEEQPALIASLQHHGLTAENGSAVPL